MDLQNIPYRSVVVTWSPDDLADYFKKLKYKDCEKVIRKHSISGQRFLNMSENDIQKFPKLSMPIVSKLSQEINRNEGRISFFPKRTQTQKFAENAGCCQEEEEGWSSFEEDDYESPDDEQENEADYESPTDEPEHESDDYEPPPSNNDAAPHNVIFPAKSIPSNTDYIDRPTTARSSPQPPIPPQRPGPSPAQAPYAGRGAPMSPYPPPPSNNDVNRDRSAKPLKPLAPSIDRRTKPPLDHRPGPPFDSQAGGKRGVFPDKPLTPQLRSLGEQLAKIQKPPIPTADKYERGNPVLGKKPPPVKQGWVPERRHDEEDEPMSQRPVPQPSLSSFSSNTFPSRSVKPPPKHTSLGSKSMPGAYSESSSNSISSSGSLPPRLQPGNINRDHSRGPADGRPPLPIPNRQIVQPPSMGEDEFQDSLNTEWYVADISRQEAEAALRKINQDGTFLVRDSSRKTNTHPYVLMVLYNDKVYNIQIRYQEQNRVYLLGTGLKGKEDFSSVEDIIDYFQRTPLLLIDGKDRGLRNQCKLTYSAGHI